jgi:hypothetical protein
VAALRLGLDLLYLRFCSSRGLDLEDRRPGGPEAWMLDAGCWQNWNGFRGWLLDGRKDWKEVSHARPSRRLVDFNQWRVKPGLLTREVNLSLYKFVQMLHFGLASSLNFKGMDRLSSNPRRQIVILMIILNAL